MNRRSFIASAAAFILAPWDWAKKPAPVAVETVQSWASWTPLDDYHVPPLWCNGVVYGHFEVVDVRFHDAVTGNIKTVRARCGEEFQVPVDSFRAIDVTPVVGDGSEITEIKLFPAKEPRTVSRFDDRNKKRLRAHQAPSHSAGSSKN